MKNAKKTKNTMAKFSRWNQPVPCRMCGKKTTWAEGNGYVGLDLCKKCFDLATLENAHNDGYHKEGRDGFAEDCPWCQEQRRDEAEAKQIVTELRKKKTEKETNMKTTAKTAKKA